MTAIQIAADMFLVKENYKQAKKDFDTKKIGKRELNKARKEYETLFYACQEYTGVKVIVQLDLFQKL